jgi:translocon-associated protein subunit alpha
LGYFDNFSKNQFLDKNINEILTLNSGSVELPAGHIVEFLVGFENKGDSDFVVEALDASFRYPMDFSYHIQNFSAIAYQKTVKPAQVSSRVYF